MIRTGEVVRLGAISGRRYEQDVGQKETLGGTVAVDRLCVYVRLNEGVDKGDHEEIWNWHSVTSFISSDFGSSHHLPGVLIETDTFTAIQTHIYKESRAGAGGCGRTGTVCEQSLAVGDILARCGSSSVSVAACDAARAA